ncbi:MAG: putative bifunctional diguanylate cyclase/phosphodiesterase [Jatrophihabitantaceae bacterium]
MKVRRSALSRAGTRLFVAYAVVSLIPVAALGAVLVRADQRSGTARGMAQGRAQAAVIVQMAIAPALGRQDLSAGLTAQERERLHEATDLAIYSGSVTAMRLRTFAGHVVFADDGNSSDQLASTDPAFVTAAKGGTDAAIVPSPLGGAGPVIRVLQPVVPNATGQATGVLELYLPYQPIAAVVRSEAHQTFVRLAEGLAALYLLLAVISWSTTRRLRRYAAAQEHQAQHDPLTGLPNRAWFREQAAAAVESADGSAGALVLVDLNRFKEVNDTFGHHAGDDLLQCVARRLADSIRTDDSVARLGGDEFGLILPGVTDRSEALLMLGRVQQELSADVEIEGSTLSVEASFGVTLYPEHGTDVSQLIRQADAAMYQGKRGVERIVLWQPGTAPAPTHWHEVHSDLQRALERDELTLHYQPKLDLRTGAVMGVEALVRWNHPQRGLLAPAEFVPAAENSTLIHPLTRWVLRRALADQAEWLRRGIDWTVAVNVSARNLEVHDFADQVRRLISETGCDPRRVTLELTETAFAVDGTTARNTVAALAAMGITVSLDDFGTGSTGLWQLRDLSVHEIKIDAVFVRDLARSAGDRSLVQAMIDLAHGIGCSVVAEGVEDRGGAEWLESIGCDIAQGYLFQRPAPWPELLERFGGPAAGSDAPAIETIPADVQQGSHSATSTGVPR